MSRLRYNGLKATLAGSGLTNSGTTITFAAALTYDGGTAVPTLSGDYIPLTIMDADGVPKEIVYLTAYTTATTTGTITRAQESTAGVAHVAGVQVMNAPTVLDFVIPAAGAYANPIDDPASMGSDLGFDYEFDAGTFTTPVTSLPSGWSWVNQGGSTYSEALGAGALTAPANSGEQLRTIARSLSGAPSTWNLYAKLALPLSIGAAYAEVGMVFRDSASNTARQLGVYVDGSMKAAVTGWSNNTVPSFPFLGGVVPPIPYWRIRKNSSTSYDFMFSEDGTAWFTILSANNPSFTPDQIGFAINRNHGSLPLTAAISWIRLR